MSDNFLKVYNGLALNPRSTDPANPAEGDVQFSDGTHRPKGLWVYFNSNWRQAGGGGGEGFNYFEDTNADGEAGTGEWTVYKNTTAGNTLGSVPAPDDFGGTASGNLTWTTNATDPLIEDADFKLSKAASNVQGEGVYYEFTGQRAHLGLKMLFRVYSDLSEFDDNDISIWLVSSNDGFTSDFNVISANNPEVLAQKITAKQFQLDISDLSYRICIHYGSTDTDAKDAYFDGFFFGPKDVATSNKSLASNIAVTAGTHPNSGAAGKITTTYTVRNDEIGGWDSVNEEFVIPEDGNYTISAAVGFTANSTGTRGLGVYNDTLGEFVFFENTQATSAGNVYNSGSKTLFLEAGTVLHLYAQQNSGGNLAFITTFDSTYLTIVKENTAVSSEDLGGRAIRVEAEGNSGQAVTSSSDIPFETVTLDTTASWNGTTFTAPESGTYAVSGNMQYSVSQTNPFTNAVINGVSGKRLSSEIGNTGAIFFSGHVELKKGDVFSVRQSESANLGNTASIHNISITKIANPQTMLESEIVAFRATCDTGQVISSQQTIIYNNVSGDTHGAYNPSTGEYTAPVSGWYDVDAKIAMDDLVNSDERLIIRLKVDGIELAQNVKEFESTGTYLNTVYVATKIYLNKGEIVTITGQGSGGDNLIANDLFNSFAISRIK